MTTKNHFPQDWQSNVLSATVISTKDARTIKCHRTSRSIVRPSKIWMNETSPFNTPSAGKSFKSSNSQSINVSEPHKNQFVSICLLPISLFYICLRHLCCCWWWSWTLFEKHNLFISILNLPNSFVVPANTRIIRGCGYEARNYQNQCYKRHGFGGRQTVCACETGDHCNHSSTMKSSFMLIALISGAIAYLSH